MEKRKWKLGELEFDSEQEYLDASEDLKRIKQILAKHDVSKPAEARNVLRELKSSPPFASFYGTRFKTMLEKTIDDDDKEKRRKIQAAQEAAKKEQAAKKVHREPRAKQAKTVQTERAVKPEKTQKQVKAQKPQRTEKGVHIITRRNILVGAVIILLAVGVRFAWPYVQPYFAGGAESEKDLRRNLVLSYAKNQVELESSFYNYYTKVQGQDDAAATATANDVLSNAYCVNLADENVSDYTDDQIEEVYEKLIASGELVDNSFNEPQAITDLKAIVEESGVAGLSGGEEDDSQTSVDSGQVSLINKMMDYQQRVAAQLTYDYSHFDFSNDEIAGYVADDMETIFNYTVYDRQLSDSEKESYYSVYEERGLIASGKLQRVDSNPVAYNLPDLTPTVKLETDDEQELTCTQQTIAPAASVTYELHKKKKTGYIAFRGNGTGTSFVQDDDGNSVAIQGDFFLNWDGKITCGEWYYNSGKLGLLVDGQKAGDVQYVYDLVY